MRHIGKSPPRPDGPAKVRGRSLYADDVGRPGLYYGATLRSPHPHARIEKLVFDPTRAPADAVAVTANDISGPNGVQLLDDTWPILADTTVNHVGESVALVAAPTKLAALRALEAFTVEYSTLPPVLDIEAAADNDLLSELTLSTGDTSEAFDRAEKIIEGTYRTGHQEHIYIEPQVMTAWFEDNETLVVEGSMQCPYYVQNALLHTFGLPAEKVRVRVPAVGGGFGGKEDYPSLLALHVALLARATGRPVRILYDRHEDIIATTKRHPSLIHHRTAVDKDGHLQAMDIDVVLDGGAYRTLSPVVLSRAVLHATGPYRCPNVRIRGRVVRTHTATNGAFRGFGAPQAQFAAERQIDRIARRLGLDPLEIRLRNALEPGDRLATGQILDETASALPCLELAAKETDFRRRWQENEKRRGESTDGQLAHGLGLSLFFHGSGFTGNGERKMRSPVTARLLEDGRIEILTSMIDMGQGCDTIFIQMACEATGLEAGDFQLAEPDTARVPDSGPTVASRTTMVIGKTLTEAVRDVRDRVVAWATDEEGDTASGFCELARRYLAANGPLEVTHRYEPPTEQSFDEETYQGDAYPVHGWGADVVEVEVDPDTLQARATHVTAVSEVGRVIHPTLCKGQIEGGTLQAVAWGLMEEIKLENGRYLNDRLATYIIPTIRDSPTMDVHLLEHPWSDGSYGAKGVGEMPMDGGAPAALAAIENATGLLGAEIPATPERLLAWTVRNQTVKAFTAEDDQNED